MIARGVTLAEHHLGDDGTPLDLSFMADQLPEQPPELPPRKLPPEQLSGLNSDGDLVKGAVNAVTQKWKDSITAHYLREVSLATVRSVSMTIDTLIDVL